MVLLHTTAGWNNREKFVKIFFSNYQLKHCIFFILFNLPIIIRINKARNKIEADNYKYLKDAIFSAEEIEFKADFLATLFSVQFLLKNCFRRTLANKF